MVMESYCSGEVLSNRALDKWPGKSEPIQLFAMEKYPSLEASSLPSCALAGWHCVTLAQIGIDSGGMRKACLSVSP